VVKKLIAQPSRAGLLNQMKKSTIKEEKREEADSMSEEHEEPHSSDNEFVVQDGLEQEGYSDDVLEERAGIAQPGERESLTGVDVAVLEMAIPSGPTRDIAPFETESEILYPVPYGQGEGVDPQVTGNHLLFYTDSYGVDPDEIRPAIKLGENVTRVYRQPGECKTIVSKIELPFVATTLRIAHTQRYMIVAIPKPIHGRQHGFMPLLKVEQMHGIDPHMISLDNIVGPQPAPSAAAQPQALPFVTLPVPPFPPFPVMPAPWAPLVAPLPVQPPAQHVASPQPPAPSPAHPAVGQPSPALAPNLALEEDDESTLRLSQVYPNL